MSLSFNPQTWLSYGPFQYSFYIAKQLPRMNHLNCFHWIKTMGQESIQPSDKYLEFLVAGTPVDISKGRVERYMINIKEQDVTVNNLQINPSFQYKFQYPVINTQVAKNVMAVRTIQNTINLVRFSQPQSICKFKFPQPPRQNLNKTLAWNPAGDSLLAGSHSKTIYLYDLYTQKSKSFVTDYSKQITDIVWIDNKYFATATNGGKILIWSIGQNKPICGFSDKSNISLTAPTCLSLVKKGNSIDDLILLSATGRVTTMWDRRSQKNIHFKGGQNSSQITKINCKGVMNKDRIFAALDQGGTIVTYQKNDQSSIYCNPNFGIQDFDCSNGYYGIVGVKRIFAIWTPQIKINQKPTKQNIYAKVYNK